jgi:DNA-binding LacI/PurR family transcriptional regulator
MSCDGTVLKMNTTLRDIGRMLGLSATTVSLALRDHPRIPANTKRRVYRVMRQLKYEPDQVARALVIGRSNLVGVIVPNSSDPYYAEVFRGIEDSARSTEYHVLLSNGSYDMNGYAERVREMMGLHVRSIIAAPPFVSERPKLSSPWRELCTSNVQVVLVNRRLDPPIFHQVTADYISGVRMVVEALASRGHRRVAYISGQPAMLPILQRLAAFKRYSRRYGFENDSSLFECSQLDFRGGYEACNRLWTRVGKKKPTAIVAFSDTVAVGALRFIHEKEIKVPEDVSVASFDGIKLSEFTHVGLSTVETPMYEIGKQAFDLLMGSLRGVYSWPQSLVLPVKLLLRESVGPARIMKGIRPVNPSSVAKAAA